MSKKDRNDVDGRKKRKRSRSHSRGKSPFNKELKKPKEKKRNTFVETDDTNNSMNVSSMSINDANKLRAKLGLSALELDNDKQADGSGSIQTKGGETEFVHVPAKNVSEIKKTEKIEEKLATAKEKRKYLEKLRTVKSLGTHEEENASSWVEKMRLKEKQKLEAISREKMLSEMDEQFGITQLVNESLKSNINEKYTANDLRGLKVEHKTDRFIEGTPIILTLKDKGILEEDDSDVLVNVNIADDEKADKNNQNKRNTLGFGGIAQDEDENVLLGLRSKGVLEKYDAEIDGPKTEEFVLSTGGSYLVEHEEAMRRLTNELQSGGQSVNDYKMQIASDYYSVNEMENFKSRKRKAKVHRRTLIADDLIASDSTEIKSKTPVLLSKQSRDHGSRRSHKSKPVRIVEDEPEEGEINDNDMQSSRTNHRNSVIQKVSVTESNLNQAISALLDAQTIENNDSDVFNGWNNELTEPDDLQIELEKTLDRVRRSHLSKPPKPEDVAIQVLKNKSELPKLEYNNDTSTTSTTLVFDSTAEFFKQISGGLQSANQAKYIQSIKTADDVTATLIKKEPANSLLKEERLDRNSSNYNEKTSHSRSTRSPKKYHSTSKSSKSRDRSKRTAGVRSKVKEENEEVKGVLDDEPELNQGVFSALVLAQKKGYVESQKEKERPIGNLVNLMAKHIVEEDVRHDDIDAKFAKRERYAGPLSDFREKSTYKPDVHLHYVDELGRAMSQKEAFRQLSHKFHGKGSGKKKIEKRTKKIMEESLLKGSVSSDTPLGTADKLNKKLKRQGTPYVVLSGKNVAPRNLMK